MKRCAIIDDYQECALALGDWRSLAPEVEVAVCKDHLDDEDAIVDRLGDFEIVCIMRERTPFPRSLIEKLPKLALLLSSGARNRSIDLDAARDHGVIVCDTPWTSNPTVELTWGLIFAVVRNIPLEDRSTRLGAWQRTVGPELNGKVLGVLGAGRIGGRVATVGQAFGMTVIGWSQNLTQERCAELGIDLVTKDELFARSDVLTIHLVLSDRSRGLVGPDDIARMKPSAFLVNTARGPIVDEAALVGALEKQAIAGAALDVFDVEPLPLDHPLRRLENTVITPHLGYVSVENYREFYAGAIANVRTWLDGRLAVEPR